jgi:hypothetical protein
MINYDDEDEDEDELENNFCAYGRKTMALYPASV